MPETVIRTRGLRKVYVSGFFRSKFVGLAGLDLDVYRGEVFGYIGPNGSGKTTTIKLLMGLNFPSGGEGEVLGKPIGDRATRRQIGYLPERPYFYDYLTAEEFLHFYGSLHGMTKGERQRKIDELLPLVHMERARDVQLRKFSKGMLQRVGVAQALINDPELVVFDEPASGLDPMGRLLIRDTILRLRDGGTTVMLSSHILSDVESVCDRVGMIAGGELQRIAAVSELVGERVASVEITLEGATDELLAELGAGDGHLHASGRRTLTVPDEAKAQDVARQALAGGATLISLVPRRESLESLFVDEMTSIEKATREEKR
jgi:ABC-2 type transport system ATP-binding protein